MRSAAASALAALALLTAGCGGSEEDEASGSPPSPPPAPATTTTEPEAAAADVGVYLVRDGKLGYARRSVPATPSATLEELLAGPTEAERAAGLTSDLPPDTGIVSLELVGDDAHVELSSSLGELATMQVVHTLAQLETVDRVRLDGDEYVDGDTEEALPAILVESPPPNATVASPLTIRGTANTYEATFMVELRAEGEGKPLLSDFVTATSGSGTRGTFEEALEFEADRKRPGKLVVYERSAEDNSIVNKVEIPVTIRP